MLSIYTLDDMPLFDGGKGRINNFRSHNHDTQYGMSYISSPNPCTYHGDGNIMPSDSLAPQTSPTQSCLL